MCVWASSLCFYLRLRHSHHSEGSFRHVGTLHRGQHSAGQPNLQRHVCVHDGIGDLPGQVGDHNKSALLRKVFLCSCFMLTRCAGLWFLKFSVMVVSGFLDFCPKLVNCMTRLWSWASTTSSPLSLLLLLVSCWYFLVCCVDSQLI